MKVQLMSGLVRYGAFANIVCPKFKITQAPNTPYRYSILREIYAGSTQEIKPGF